MCWPTMHFGGDDDRIRRRDEGILCDRATDITHWDFGCECLAMVDNRLWVTVVYVDYQSRKT